MCDKGGTYKVGDKNFPKPVIRVKLALENNGEKSPYKRGPFAKGIPSSRWTKTGKSKLLKSKKQ